MKLTHKTFLTVSGALAGLIGAAYGVASAVLIDGFLEVERKTTSLNLRRAADAVQTEVDNLSVKLSDWSAWDDTCRFVDGEEPGFISKNLTRKTMDNLGVQAVAFADRAHRIVFGASAGAGRTMGPLPAGLAELVQSDRSLARLGTPGSAIAGPVRLPEGLYLVACRPIVGTDMQGPVRGTAMFAHRIDDAALAALSARTHMELAIDPAPEGLVRGAIRLERLDPRHIAATTLVEDVDGRPTLAVRAVLPRYVYQQAITSARYLLVSLVCIGAAFAGVVLVLISRLVLAPIARLNREVTGVGSSGDLSRGVSVAGGDEIAGLGASINGLLSAAEQSQARLRESEERFRLLADHAPVLIWMCDAAGACTYVNRGWLEFVGCGADSQSGAGWLGAIHPEDRAAFEGALGGARGSFSVECRLRRRDGQFRWVATSATARAGASGGAAGYIGTCTDITDRRLAEERLRRFADDLVRAKETLEGQARELAGARDQARTASRAKSEFLANMSHEIRTPMTAIIGFADLLQDPTLSGPDRADYVQIIRRNGEHLLTIINDILDLSKIEEGKMAVERIPCSPVQIVAEVYSLMQVRALHRGISLSVEHQFPLPTTILCDAVRLRQILVNLVGNAIKFTGEGGSIRIRTRLMPGEGGGSRIAVEVADTGVGMSAEQTARLFRPFTQADTSMTRKFGGTGLGLSISRQLAVLLGGDISVVSEPGSGSTFTATVATGPIDGVEMLTGSACAVAAPRPEPAPAPKIVGRILLAEDGPDNQRLICFYLRKGGAQVEVVENGRAAVERALEAAEEPASRFDLVLMDMQMPDLDGYAAAAELRRRGYRGAVVALTAHAMTGDREKCLAAGCDDYLTKPVSRVELLRLCSEWCERSRGGGPWTGEGLHRAA